MASTFTIDPNRLERFRAEADAARRDSRTESERINEAHREFREAEDDLRRLENSHRGAPSIINVRGETGTMRRVTESKHDLYLDRARNRVEAARKELASLRRSQRDGAAARQHMTELFSRVSAHEKGFARWP